MGKVLDQSIIPVLRKIPKNHLKFNFRWWTNSKFKNSFFPVLIYWSDNRIHLGFSNSGFSPPPTIASTELVFYRSNLIFWIVMGCGKAHFGRRGLKTSQTQKILVYNFVPRDLDSQRYNVAYIVHRDDMSLAVAWTTTRSTRGWSYGC